MSRSPPGNSRRRSRSVLLPPAESRLQRTRARRTAKAKGRQDLRNELVQVRAPFHFTRLDPYSSFPTSCPLHRIEYACTCTTCFPVQILCASLTWCEFA